MAKFEHEEELTGGLTGGLNFGASREARQGRGAAPASTPAAAAASQGNSLLDGYRPSRPERRSIRMNIMTKPSIAGKMDDDVNSGRIKSRNDLINYLLETFYEERDAQKKK